LKEQIETRMRKFFANEIFESCRSIDIVTKKKKKDTITKTTKPGHSFCLVYHTFQAELIQRVPVAGQETEIARHLVEACPIFLYADDAALAGTDGYNVLTASCTMGSVTVANGKTLKIKKDPSVVGEIVLDRQATIANKGYIFVVHSQATIVMEGITLTGGYAPVSLYFFKYSSINNMTSLFSNDFSFSSFFSSSSLIKLLLRSFFILQ